MARGSVRPIQRKGKDGTAYRVWRAVVPGGVGPDGKRRQVTKTFSARAAADRWVAERIAAGGQAPERMTVSGLLDRWLPLHAREVRRSTARLDEWAAGYIRAGLGGVRLDRLGPLDVQAFYDGLDGLLAPASIQQVHRVLGGALGQATDWELIARNPARRTKRPPVTAPPLTVWDAGQVSRFLEATRDDVDGPLFALLLGTGLRIGEALAVDWRHVDAERGTLLVERTMTHGAGNTVVVGDRAKTGSSRRRIVLPLAAQAALARQRKAQEARRDDLGDAWRGDGAVFDRGDGARRRANDVRRRLKAINGRLGLPHLSPHGLRHTLATALKRRRVPIEDIQALLGHASSRITSDLYVHFDDTDRETLAREIDAAINGQGGLSVTTMAEDGEDAASGSQSQ